MLVFFLVLLTPLLLWTVRVSCNSINSISVDVESLSETSVSIFQDLPRIISLFSCISVENHEIE